MEICAKTTAILGGITSGSLNSGYPAAMSIDHKFLIERSSIDESRFGVRTTRAFVTSEAESRRVVEACRENGTELLIVRCAVTNVRVVQVLEENGARLMDTLVYSGLDLRKFAAGGPDQANDGNDAIALREAVPADRDQLAQVSRSAFHDYIGHYHADARLSRHDCDAVYVSWAENSLTLRSPSDNVMVAEQNGAILGFITVRLNGAAESEVVLNALTPKAQGRGVNRLLFLHAIEWSRKKGASRLLVSTQISNVRAQRVWARLGMEPNSALYTLHQWFNKSDHQRLP